MRLLRQLARLEGAGPGSKGKPSRALPVSDTLSDTVSNPLSNTVSNTLSDTVSDTASDTVSDTVSVSEPILAARLARARASLLSLPAAPKPVPHVSAADALAAALGAAVPRLERTAGGALPGRREETPHGPLHRVHHLLEPHHHHGRVRVASALEVSTELVADLALDRAFAHRDLRRVLFLDTETTGLSTSSGTVAFLIGAAFFEDESLHVEQLLLTSYHEESAMLRHLAGRIADADMVASYNGKSFDWPLLRTRFVMNRVPAPALPPHLDLLHCSRRIFKRRLDSVRLVDMERELLGFVREHDVSGAEIPSIYNHFVRSGDPGRLDGVVEHNAHDLVALAAILGELGRRYGVLRKEDDPEDHLGFAKVAERSGDATRARHFAWAAAEGGGDDACTLEALLVAARVARREGDLAGELRALGRALEVQPSPEVHALLAKHHEHRSKDLMRALLHASQSEEPRRWARLRAKVARGNRRQHARRA